MEPRTEQLIGDELAIARNSALEGVDALLVEKYLESALTYFAGLLRRLPPPKVSGVRWVTYGFMTLLNGEAIRAAGISTEKAKAALPHFQSAIAHIDEALASWSRRDSGPTSADQKPKPEGA